MLAGGVASLLGGAIWVAAAVAAVGGAIALAGLARHYPHRRLGLCNVVTLARGGLVAGLAGLLAAPQVLEGFVAWAALGVALLALAMDGLDGWAARRAGLSSDFGARLDMEVDVALGLILALLAWLSGKAGFWVLGLGLMRHVFVAAGWVLPALQGALFPSFRRKLVCVIQIAALIALMAPVVQPPLAGWIAGVALAILGASFLRDAVWLLARGRRA
ncbi:CDP-alcohol phosphatidyltransferase [Halovulum dunhuangense]|uniref:CDP-alcohol phosphatidyltransferase n=1 Tax=Halovulum dunhuangense TaxID=1505036 RepID=A0A849KRG8_9RHOB|nr:CDP-alcohol phosphatidyltransferase [Halovulum dunhuangense]